MLRSFGLGVAEVRREIVVVGSLNMDFVFQVPKIPARGETIIGSNFTMVPGGKGANQAYAAAKLGGRVKMIGKLGNDPFAPRLRENLGLVGVNVDHILIDEESPSGVAMIAVEEGSGENSIVVISGSNWKLRPEDVESVAPVIEGAGVVLFQLETPLDTVERAMDIARRGGARVILDPAPARPLSEGLLKKVDILTPNEGEALILSGKSPEEGLDIERAKVVAEGLLNLGIPTVILKLGERGALIAQRGKFDWVEGIKVEAVDTTAAGDAFAGGLAVGLTEGMDLREAVEFANRVAALSVTKLGAQSSMPTRREVEDARYS
ncbi:MAG: ribokinase [bacterium]